jgi:protein-S-isoprenylcysteine O-methyltransferase Ste14
MKSWLLVGLQATILLALLATGPVWAGGRIAQGVEAAGVALGLWAMATMGSRHLRPTPEPAEGARLLRHGPYRWIRHPMYTATLLAAGALVVDHVSMARAAIWFGLVTVLVVKLRFEEGLLMAKFPDYADYARRTRRLVPGLW